MVNPGRRPECASDEPPRFRDRWPDTEFMDADPGEGRPLVVVRLARCGRFKVRCRRGEPGQAPTSPDGRSPLFLAWLVAGDALGTRTPQPPGTKRKNPAWRGVTEVREPSCGPGRCGAGDGAVIHSELQPQVAIVAQASRIPAKIIGIVSWLPQENVPPCKPMPRTTPVFERGRSQPCYFIRTDSAKVAVGFRVAAGRDVSSQPMPPASARHGR